MLEHERVVTYFPQLHNRVHQHFCATFTLKIMLNVNISCSFQTLLPKNLQSKSMEWFLYMSIYVMEDLKTICTNIWKDYISVIT